MGFLDFLRSEGLDRFVGAAERRNMARFSFAYIGPYRDGYRFASGKYEYRVTTRKSDFGDGYVYDVERREGLNDWEAVRCGTDAEERRFPKCPAWLGTLMVRRREETRVKERQYALFA